jgi:hypothetical protein
LDRCYNFTFDFSNNEIINNIKLILFFALTYRQNCNILVELSNRIALLVGVILGLGQKAVNRFDILREADSLQHFYLQLRLR